MDFWEYFGHGQGQIYADDFHFDDSIYEINKLPIATNNEMRTFFQVWSQTVIIIIKNIIL